MPRGKPIPIVFIVAITRAQALLIVVGNPTLLSLDPIWRSFLNYVHQGGGWRGKAPDWDTNEIVDFERNFTNERREKVQADTEDTITRIRSMIIEASDANWEVPDVEDDEDDEPAWRDDYQ